MLHRRTAGSMRRRSVALDAVRRRRTTLARCWSSPPGSGAVTPYSGRSRCSPHDSSVRERRTIWASPPLWRRGPLTGCVTTVLLLLKRRRRVVRYRVLRTGRRSRSSAGSALQASVRGTSGNLSRSAWPNGIDRRTFSNDLRKRPTAGRRQRFGLVLGDYVLLCHSFSFGGSKRMCLRRSRRTFEYPIFLISGPRLYLSRLATLDSICSHLCLTSLK